MSEERPRIVVTVAAPVEAVWDALRDKEKIRHWHGWEYEGPQGGLEEEIDLIYFTQETADPANAVLTLGSGDEFVVEPVEGGSRITLTRAAHGDNPEWEAYYDDVTEGWITFLNQLRFAVESHPGEPRRTLFYSGAGARSPIAELGIDVQPGGTPYELDLVGEQAKGQVWFTSEHQVGLTVDGWGNGLLVLSHIPPGSAKPDGASMAVLSLYGDVDRDALDARWKAWWEERYPVPLDLGG
ncbi:MULTISPECIES: SRPBCC domain-containing protein [unclassified Kribbella]|uniref:SRPBCC family protein n=1 Tax=unclassified Kribbella TaxID=2644121 RepID=UPI0033D38A56